jgi:hypothetical protein
VRASPTKDDAACVAKCLGCPCIAKKIFHPFDAHRGIMLASLYPCSLLGKDVLTCAGAAAWLLTKASPALCLLARPFPSAFSTYRRWMELLRPCGSCELAQRAWRVQETLGHKIFAAGPLQPRRKKLRGERAGLVQSPPRLQFEQSG